MERLGGVREEIAAAEALVNKLEDLNLGLELLELEVGASSRQYLSVDRKTLQMCMRKDQGGCGAAKTVAYNSEDLTLGLELLYEGRGH